MMKNLKGYQKQYLKGLVHGAKPLVFIGQNGIATTVLKAIDEALKQHEIIKIKYIDFKEKEQKNEMNLEIEKETHSTFVGMIGHVATFYRQQSDLEKRKVIIPTR